MKGLVPQLDFSLAQDVRGVYTELWPAPGHSNARLTDDDHLNRRDCLAAAALGLNRPIATAAGLRAGLHSAHCPRHSPLLCHCPRFPSTGCPSPRTAFLAKMASAGNPARF